MSVGRLCCANSPREEKCVALSIKSQNFGIDLPFEPLAKIMTFEPLVKIVTFEPLAKSVTFERLEKIVTFLTLGKDSDF